MKMFYTYDRIRQARPASCLVFLLLFLAALAQSQTKTASIVDTAWRGPDVPFDTSLGPAVTQQFYGFEPGGKVTRRLVTFHVSNLQAIPAYQSPSFNPFPWAYQDGGDPYASTSPFRLRLQTTPVVAPIVLDYAGTYTVSGNRVEILLKGVTINATISGNTMSGVSKGASVESLENNGNWNLNRIVSDTAKAVDEVQANEPSKKSPSKGDETSEEKFTRILLDAQRLGREQTEMLSKRAITNLRSQLGTYVINTELKKGNIRTPIELTLKITAVDDDGNVLAILESGILQSSGEAISSKLAGETFGWTKDDLGRLRLAGIVTFANRSLQLDLAATLQKERLTNGVIYIGTPPDSLVASGEFSIATLKRYR